MRRDKQSCKIGKCQYYLYAHDDFYFRPNWDEILNHEIKLVGHNNFYLSGTMMNEGQIPFNCGSNVIILMKISLLTILRNLIILIFKDRLGLLLLFIKIHG